MAEKWLFLLDEVFIFPYNKLVIPCVVQYVLMKAHCYCVGRANNSYQYSHKLEIDKIGLKITPPPMPNKPESKPINNPKTMTNNKFCFT